MRTLTRVRDVFEECQVELLRQFDDFGRIRFKWDEKAGSDNGAGADRQYAYCAEGDPIVIAFAPKAELLPISRVRGLMRHEMGHALEYRYGVRELEERLGEPLPGKVERRADEIAELVWGTPLGYDERDVQCVGCRDATRPRPSYLPDKAEKLVANPATTRGKVEVGRGDDAEVVVYWKPGDEGYEGIVPDENPGTAGFVVLQPFENGYQVEYIEVDESYRRRGVATRLYQEAMKIAREHGGPLVSDSRQEKEAKAFWEKMRELGLADRVFEGSVSYYRMNDDAPSVLPNPLPRRPRDGSNLPDSLPDWARPNEAEMRRVGSSASDLLNNMTDAQIEKMLFGVSSMNGYVDVSPEEIEWNPSRQGTYDEVYEEVEENGEDYYDVSYPIIVDLLWSGDLELNDGHHRLLVNLEFEGGHPMEADVQIPPGLARAWAMKLCQAVSDPGAGLQPNTTLLGFDMFDDQPCEPPTEAEKQYREFEDLGSGSVVYLGGRKPGFKIFKSDGITKYATVEGSKGRKFYHLQVDSRAPFIVGAYEVLGQDPFKQSSVSKAKPGLPVRR